MEEVGNCLSQLGVWSGAKSPPASPGQSPEGKAPGSSENLQIYGTKKGQKIMLMEVFLSEKFENRMETHV